MTRCVSTPREISPSKNIFGPYPCTCLRGTDIDKHNPAACNFKKKEVFLKVLGGIGDGARAAAISTGVSCDVVFPGACVYFRYSWALPALVALVQTCVFLVLFLFLSCECT